MQRKRVIFSLVSFIILTNFGAAYGIGIFKAQYGWNKWVDVTTKVNSMCAGKDPCRFKVSNDNFGDPDVGEDKFLRIWALPYPNLPLTCEVPEYDTIVIYSVFVPTCKKE